MTELEKKAVSESMKYNTKYSEDRDLQKALKNPEKFVNSYDYTLGIVNLLREKAYRDGYIAGAKELDKENKRAKTLLKATYDLLKKCDDSYHVKYVLCEKVMYDNAECDGYCLFDDIENFLNFGS